MSQKKQDCSKSQWMNCIFVKEKYGYALSVYHTISHISPIRQALLDA